MQQYTPQVATDQLAELQTRLAFQEDAIQQLDGQLAQQQAGLREVRVVLKEVLQELEHLRMALDERSGGGEDPLPPHY